MCKRVSIFILVGTLAFLTGCGAQSLAPKKKAAAATTTFGTGTSDPTPAPSSTPSPTAPYIGVPPISYRVGAIGYTTDSVTVDARSTLKIRFTPGVQDEKVAGTGYSPQYSKLGVYIQVGSQTKPTPMLPNGMTDPSQDSGVMDFSRSIDTSLCSAGNPNCRVTVTINITKPNYDYWCLNFQQYCPNTTIYSTHPWHGTVQIQTDDTDPL